MSQFINPNYKAHMDLGGPEFTDDEWAILKKKITDHLDENAGSGSLDVAACRAVDSRLAHDRTWAQAAGDCGITMVYDRPEPA